MRRIVWIPLLAVTLGACDTLREQVGLTKQSPDEFQVVTKAPLVIPPDFNLRPPQPGATGPGDAQPRANAQAALLGQQSSRAAAPAQSSAGESALLSASGANRADPNIRQVLAQEATPFAERDRGFVDRILFWQRPAQQQAAQGPVVDPRAERERLRQNAQAGLPPGAGAQTPTIERRRRGLF